LLKEATATPVGLPAVDQEAKPLTTPGATTLRVVVTVSPLIVAVTIVVAPTEAEAVTRPPELIVATPGADEFVKLHVTLLVTSPVVPFEYVPVASNCSDPPVVRLTVFCPDTG